jgi:hypothetical protein
LQVGVAFAAHSTHWLRRCQVSLLWPPIHQSRLHPQRQRCTLTLGGLSARPLLEYRVTAQFHQITIEVVGGQLRA